MSEYAILIDLILGIVNSSVKFSSVSVHANFNKNHRAKSSPCTPNAAFFEIFQTYLYPYSFNDMNGVSKRLG